MANQFIQCLAINVCAPKSDSTDWFTRCQTKTMSQPRIIYSEPNIQIYVCMLICNPIIQATDSCMERAIANWINGKFLFS